MEPQYTPERFDKWIAKMMGLGKCVLGINLLHTLINYGGNLHQYQKNDQPEKVGALIFWGCVINPPLTLSMEKCGGVT